MQKRILVILALSVLFVFSSSDAFARTAIAPTDSFIARFFSKKTPTPKPTTNPSPSSTPKSSPSPSLTPTTKPATPSPTPQIKSGMVTLTFDDGSKSQYEAGWPILQKYGFRATFYISTQGLDGFWYMTPQMVKNLYAAGNHIAAHTISHRDLTTLSPNEVDKELREPQQYLQNLIGAPVRDFATPFGSYNAQTLEAISKYYRSHRTVKEGYNSQSSPDTAELLVKNIHNSTSASQISEWANIAKQNNSWLILVYHEIKENPDQWSTTPAILDAQLKAIKDSGVPVRTLNQALSN